MSAAGLLLIYLNGVSLLHFQRGRSVVLVYGLAVKAEAHHLHGESGPVAVGIHQLPQRCVLLNLKLDDCIVLSKDFQVNMLSFTAFLFVRHVFFFSSLRSRLSVKEVLVR